MIAVTVEEEPPPDPFAWRPLSPAQVTAILEAWDHWPWIRALRDPHLPPLPLNTSSDTGILRRADDRVIVQQALAWLSAAYPIEADAVVGYYYEHETVAQLADWQGSAEVTVYKRIQRGVRRMAYRTGWVEPKETGS